MTVKELIEILQAMNRPEARVQIQVTEPYDDDAETLVEDASDVSLSMTKRLEGGLLPLVTIK